MFDPYRKWLGIPEDQRPPTHYQLLGIAPDERDIEVIEAAVLRQSAFVRNFQSGQHADDATRLLNEIATARLCLVDQKKRAKYDTELHQKEAAPAGTPARPRESGTLSRRSLPTPELPPQSLPPPFDLDQLAIPEPRRISTSTRRLPAARIRSTSRRPSTATSTGYLWQVPLLAVVVIVLVLVARLIGHSIAEQRALHSQPRMEQTIPEQEDQ